MNDARGRLVALSAALALLTVMLVIRRAPVMRIDTGTTPLAEAT